MLVRKLEIDKQFVIYFFIEFRSVWCILPVRGAFLWGGGLISMAVAVKAIEGDPVRRIRV